MSIKLDKAALLQLGWKAADALLFYHGGDIAVQQKPDHSPVTKADMASHEILLQGLREITPDIPIISEEDAQHPKSGNGYYWLVDPLDGTKSFIKGRKQYTINLGLMHAHRPVFGILVAPSFNVVYWGGVDEPAMKQKRGEQAQPIRCAAKPVPSEPTHVLVSYAHMDSSTKRYVDSLGAVETTPSASAYKFCLIAEGAAHIYPRYGTTMEWDTAAGQAIVESAGGTVLKPDGREFDYGKKGYKNAAFIARGW